VVCGSGGGAGVVAVAAGRLACAVQPAVTAARISPITSRRTRALLVWFWSCPG
jgi:hypothetical protein